MRGNYTISTHNIFVSTNSTIPWIQATTSSVDQFDSLFNVCDINVFIRPGTDTSGIRLKPQYNGGGTFYYTLPTWRDFIGYDIHSTGAPKYVSSADSLMLVTNPTMANDTIHLPYKYIGSRGNIYDGSITLAPFKSEVLVQDGSKTPSTPTQ